MGQVTVTAKTMTVKSAVIVLLVLMTGCAQAPTHPSSPLRPMHKAVSAMKRLADEQAILHAIEEAIEPKETDMQALALIFSFDPKTGFGMWHAEFISRSIFFTKIKFEGLRYLPEPNDLRKMDLVTVNLSDKTCVRPYDFPKNFVRQNDLGAPFEEFYYSYYTVNNKYIAVKTNINSDCVAAMTIYVNLKDSPISQ